MKNYLIAFLLFGIAVIAIQCQRKALISKTNKPSNQRVAIASRTEGSLDTILLNEKFQIGDTITFAYTERQLLYDTLLYELSPIKTLRLVSQEKAKLSPEMMMMRMDISEYEQRLENLFVFVAEKKGQVYFSVISRIYGIDNGQAIDSKTTWKLSVE